MHTSFRGVLHLDQRIRNLKLNTFQTISEGIVSYPSILKMRRRSRKRQRLDKQLAQECVQLGFKNDFSFDYIS